MLQNFMLDQQSPGNLMPIVKNFKLNRLLLMHCVNTINTKSSSDVQAKLTLLDHDMTTGQSRYYDHTALFQGAADARYLHALGPEVCTNGRAVASQANDLPRPGYPVKSSLNQPRLVFFPAQNLWTNAGVLKGVALQGQTPRP